MKIPLALSIATLAFGAVVSLGACAGPDSSLAGKWEGYRPFPGGIPSGEAGTLARNVSLVSLTLHADGRFELIDASIPFKGHWRREGKKVALDVETLLNDRPIAQQPDSQRRVAAGYYATAGSGALTFHDLGGGAGVSLKRVADANEK